MTRGFENRNGRWFCVIYDTYYPASKFIWNRVWTEKGTRVIGFGVGVGEKRMLSVGRRTYSRR